MKKKAVTGLGTRFPGFAEGDFGILGLTKWPF